MKIHKATTQHPAPKQESHDHMDTSVYVLRVQVLLGCLNLSPPHVSHREEHLAVDVGCRHSVIVHQHQL